MAPLLEDPRFRQTWNQFSQNAEEATETAATSIWTFQHRYINPCVASIASSIEQCTGQCLPDREERARRTRERGREVGRNRAELSFDFYDDWDEDDGAASGGLLGAWGNDELDRLLAGSGSHSGGKGVDKAPKRKRGMSYGTRSGRRKSLEPDPTIIPSTNTLGFLGRLPFKFGGTLRYKPSAADLQEHPGASREEHREEEGEPLIPDDYSEEEGSPSRGKGHRRQRSSTTSSGETSDSFRSRGDIFPSDGEDDAVPLDDEFAMVLERRMTGDERSSGKARSSKGKRLSGSRPLSRTLSKTTHSSRSRPTLDGRRTSSGLSLPLASDPVAPDMEVASLRDLQIEEDRVRIEEDEEIERKRDAAIRLAVERGLHADDTGVNEQEEDNSIENTQVMSDSHQANVTGGHLESHNNNNNNNNEHDKILEDHPGNGFIPARLPNFG